MNEGKAKAARMIRTARGQLDGVLKMLEEDRYCIDVSNQVLASRAVLAKANREILRGHMESCLKAAFLSKDPQEQERMMLELMEVMEKM